jgi:Fe-S cluster assembly protein SufD
MKEYYNYLQELYTKSAWPGTNLEEWKRTDVSRLGLEDYSDENSNEEADFSSFPGIKETVSNGALIHQGFLAELKKKDEKLTFHYSSSKQLDITEDSLLQKLDKLELLHILHNKKTLFIESSPNTKHPEPVYAKYTFSGNKNVFTPKIVIHANVLSSTDIVLEFEHDNSDCLAVCNLEIHAKEGAKLSVSVINSGGSAAKLFFNYTIRTEKDSAVNFNEFHSGGKFVKSRLICDLDGEGNNLQLNGAYIVSSGCHYDLCTYQNHNTRHTYSKSLYKGVIFKNGRSVFQGLINVDESANGTDAYLSNKNILLADGARADSIPKLNIKTNDVKCSHGSTSGKLDRNQIFYLQSRGYSRKEARDMILKGFFSEIIDQYPEIVKNDLVNSIDNKLAR